MKNVEKKILCSTILIALLFAMGSQVLVSAASDEWPMFHNDLAHRGYSLSTSTWHLTVELYNQQCSFGFSSNS